MSRVTDKRQLLVVVGCIVDPTTVNVPKGMAGPATVGPRVLLVRRQEAEQKEIHLMWELPGGKVDFGETAEHALVREVFEETGYRVEIVGLLPFSYTTEWQYEGFRQHTVIFCYECNALERPKGQIPRDRKIKEVNWFALDEIDFSRVLAGSREFIWHVAQKYPVELAKHASKIAYASFVRVEPDKNIHRFYSIVLQIDPAAERPYILTTRRGRLGLHGTGTPMLEFFSSDKEFRSRLLYHLKRRHQHGYALTNCSDNFPLKDLLETFPESKGSDQQLSFW